MSPFVALSTSGVNSFSCMEAVKRVVKRDPAKAKEIQVGFVALSNKSEIGAYSIQKGFSYAVTNSEYPSGKVFESKFLI